MASIGMQAQVGKALGLHKGNWETAACLMYMQNSASQANSHGQSGL